MTEHRFTADQIQSIATVYTPEHPPIIFYGRELTRPELQMLRNALAFIRKRRSMKHLANWAIARDMLGTGSNSAFHNCRCAGIDPESKKFSDPWGDF